VGHPPQPPEPPSGSLAQLLFEDFVLGESSTVRRRSGAAGLSRTGETWTGPRSPASLCDSASPFIIRHCGRQTGRRAVASRVLGPRGAVKSKTLACQFGVVVAEGAAELPRCLQAFPFPVDQEIPATTGSKTARTRARLAWRAASVARRAVIVTSTSSWQVAVRMSPGGDDLHVERLPSVSDGAPPRRSLPLVASTHPDPNRSCCSAQRTRSRACHTLPRYSRHTISMAGAVDEQARPV